MRLCTFRIDLQSTNINWNFTLFSSFNQTYSVCVSTACQAGSCPLTGKKRQEEWTRFQILALYRIRIGFRKLVISKRIFNFLRRFYYSWMLVLAKISGIKTRMHLLWLSNPLRPGFTFIFASDCMDYVVYGPDRAKFQKGFDKVPEKLD